VEAHQKHSLTTFRINTSKSVSKQRTLTAFRMNTYEKEGEGVQLLLTRNPKKDFYPQAPLVLGGVEGLGTEGRLVDPDEHFLPSPSLKTDD